MIGLDENPSAGVKPVIFKSGIQMATAVAIVLFALYFLDFSRQSYNLNGKFPILKNEVYVENIPYPHGPVITQNIRFEKLGAWPKGVSIQLNGWKSDVSIPTRSPRLHNPSSESADLIGEYFAAVSAGFCSAAAGLLMKFASGFLVSGI